MGLKSQKVNLKVASDLTDSKDLKVLSRHGRSNLCVCGVQAKKKTAYSVKCNVCAEVNAPEHKAIEV